MYYHRYRHPHHHRRKNVVSKDFIHRKAVMDYYSWLVHGYLCERSLVRSPGVTSNPCLDFSPFHVA